MLDRSSACGYVPNNPEAKTESGVTAGMRVPPTAAPGVGAEVPTAPPNRDRVRIAFAHGIDNGGARIGAEHICGPFPYVSDHVVEPELILWIGPNRCGAPEEDRVLYALERYARVVVRQLRAEGVCVTVAVSAAGATRVFPFCLTGKPEQLSWVEQR